MAKKKKSTKNFTFICEGCGEEFPYIGTELIIATVAAVELTDHDLCEDTEEDDLEEIVDCIRDGSEFIFYEKFCSTECLIKKLQKE